jgi:hypothetical protein
MPLRRTTCPICLATLRMHHIQVYSGAKTSSKRPQRLLVHHIDDQSGHRAKGTYSQRKWRPCRLHHAGQVALSFFHPRPALQHQVFNQHCRMTLAHRWLFLTALWHHLTQRIIHRFTNSPCPENLYENHYHSRIKSQVTS